MTERPAFGTAPIRCGRTRCKWRGFETDLAQVPHPSIRSATQCACPTCGCDSYMFMTPREIASWERRKSTALMESGQTGTDGSQKPNDADAIRGAKAGSTVEPDRVQALVDRYHAEVAAGTQTVPRMARRGT